MNAAHEDVAQTKQMLRLAVMNLACAPQAQRRYVQLGWMRRAVENLTRAVDGLDTLRSAGEVNDQQAALLRTLRRQLDQQMQEHGDFLEEAEAAPREFLFGHALENDGWHAVRHLARRCHTLLAEPDSPSTAIRAK